MFCTRFSDLFVVKSPSFAEIVCFINVDPMIPRQEMYVYKIRFKHTVLVVFSDSKSPYHKAPLT